MFQRQRVRILNSCIVLSFGLGLMAWMSATKAQGIEVHEPRNAPPAPTSGWWTEPGFLPQAVAITARPAPAPRGGAPYSPECILSNGVRVTNAHGVIVDNQALYQVQMTSAGTCELVSLIRVTAAGERTASLESAHALIAAISLSAPGVAYSLRHPDRANTIFGPQVRALRSKAVIVDLMTLSPLVTRSGVTVCLLDGAALATEGQGYIPEDHSGLFVVRSDCSLEQRVVPAELRILQGDNGTAIGLLQPEHAHSARFSGPFPEPPSLNVTPVATRASNIGEPRWIVIPASSTLNASITTRISMAEARLAAAIVYQFGEEALVTVRALFFTPQGRAARVAVIGVLVIQQYFSKPAASPNWPELPSRSETDARSRKADPAAASERAEELSERHKQNKDYGDCGPEEGQRLQDRVNDACKRSFIESGVREGFSPTCENDQPEVLLWKLHTWKACADARETLNQRCFAGGNRGHRIELVQALSHVIQCLDIVERPAQ